MLCARFHNVITIQKRRKMPKVSRKDRKRDEVVVHTSQSGALAAQVKSGAKKKKKIKKNHNIVVKVRNEYLTSEASAFVCLSAQCWS